MLMWSGCNSGFVSNYVALIVRIEVNIRILIDERMDSGGQFSKQPTPIHATSLISRGDKQIRLGRELIERMKRAKVTVIQNGQVWAGFPERDILALVDGRTRLFRPQYLVIATGAYERALPVEGWTLPGVITTGAAQSLLRTYHVVAGKKVFIAGNGPFNLQVALELARAGATIVGVAESARRPTIASIRALFDMYRGAPRLLFDGIRYVNQIKKRNNWQSILDPVNHPVFRSALASFWISAHSISQS